MNRLNGRVAKLERRSSQGDEIAIIIERRIIESDGMVSEIVRTRPTGTPWGETISVETFDPTDRFHWTEFGNSATDVEEYKPA